VPEFEKRWARFSRPVGTSWRVDETDASIKGKWHHLHRAADKHGMTLDFLLRPDRGIAAAQEFFHKLLATQSPRVPRKVTLDGHDPSHRAIKRRCASMVGFRSFASAAITIAGIELAHRIHKRQFNFGRGQRFAHERNNGPWRLHSIPATSSSKDVAAFSRDAPEPSQVFPNNSGLQILKQPV
jgi:transposase-like protein